MIKHMVICLNTVNSKSIYRSYQRFKNESCNEFRDLFNNSEIHFKIVIWSLKWQKQAGNLMKSCRLQVIVRIIFDGEMSLPIIWCPSLTATWFFASIVGHFCVIIANMKRLLLLYKQSILNLDWHNSIPLWYAIISDAVFFKNNHEFLNMICRKSVTSNKRLSHHY